MKIIKQALLDVVNTTLDADEANAAEWKRAVEGWRERRKAAWLADKQPEWRALRDMLTASFKSGTPVTEKMLRDCLVSPGRYGGLYMTEHVYNEGASPPSEIRGVRRKQVPKTDLLALRDLLEAIEDETITDGQLQRLGFKNMAWVFRAAVTTQE